MSRRRRGCTLIDVLIVIALIAVLISWAWLDDAWNYKWASKSVGKFAPGGSKDGTHETAANRASACAINSSNEISGDLYTFHPGSCSISLCNGSTRMISENISVITYCGLTTYHGGVVATDSLFRSRCIDASSHPIKTGTVCSSPLCCSLVW
jgi:hypothetical protein